MLSSFGNKLANKGVHLYCDKRAVVGVWENQNSTSHKLNEILKKIFQIVFKHKCSFSLIYVESSANPDDGVSHALSKADCMISHRVWWYIEHLLGPYTVDRFSLDSNAMSDAIGKLLKHFTPYLSPQSAGIDAFAQVYPKGFNSNS